MPGPIKHLSAVCASALAWLSLSLSVRWWGAKARISRVVSLSQSLVSRTETSLYCFFCKRLVALSYMHPVSLSLVPPLSRSLCRILPCLVPSSFDF